MRWLASILAAVALVTVGGEARAGCSPTVEWRDAGPRWSPDGSRIAFYRVLPGCDPAPVAVYVVPASGGTPRLVSSARDFIRGSSRPDRLLGLGGKDRLDRRRT